MKNLSKLLIPLIIGGCWPEPTPVPPTPVDPTKKIIEPHCVVPANIQETMAEQGMVNQYGPLGYQTFLGTEESFEDMCTAVTSISGPMNLHGSKYLLDGGKASTFGAFTFPANRVVFHQDTIRMARAEAAVYEDTIAIGLPAPEFRKAMLKVVYDIIHHKYNLNDYKPAYADPQESKMLSLEILAAVAAHELAHVENNDVMDRMCYSYQHNNAYSIQAYTYNQEKNADIAGAHNVAKIYKQNPAGVATPRGFLLLMELMEALDVYSGLNGNYPPAEQRFKNVEDVFKAEGVNVDLFALPGADPFP